MDLAPDERSNKCKKDEELAYEKCVSTHVCVCLVIQDELAKLYVNLPSHLRRFFNLL